MRTSKAGLARIVAREGVRLKAYPDPATGGAPWTIGVGHTGPDVHPGMRIGMRRALALLRGDVADVEFRLSEFGVPAQRMFDALVSAGINLGVGIFGPSHTIGQDLAHKRWSKVAEDLLLYDNAPGHPHMLASRRKSERAQYLRGYRAWQRRRRTHHHPKEAKP
jgi:lysozyme